MGWIARATASVLWLLIVSGCSDDSGGTRPAPQAREWDPMGTGFALGEGDEAYVGAFTVVGGTLVAGGAFDHAGMEYARAVAQWDGQAWRSLPETPETPLFTAYVEALAPYGTDVIAGGFGTNASTVVARHGTNGWHSIGNGPWGASGVVRALAVYRGLLVAAGEPYGGNVKVSAWNDTSWTPLGDLGPGIVRALLVHGDFLIVGGSFGTAGAHSVNGITAWTGTEWLALGSGFGSGGQVSALTEHNAALIAAGSTGPGGGGAACQVARWDGTTWLQMGGEFDGWVAALTVFDGDIIAAGNFTHVGDTSANRIARWDGTHWLPLSDGADGSIEALIVFDDALVAGGRFRVASGDSVSCIARWH